MPHQHALVLFLVVGAGCLRGLEARADEAPAYEVYAVRYAKLVDFPVRALVQGAEPGRKLDIAMTVWVLRGPDGLGRFLIDAGFYRPQHVREGGRVADYTRPDRALGRLGIKPEEVTDVVVTHMHWDHADGVDLFHKARGSGSRRTVNYYTHMTKPPGDRDDNKDGDEVSAMVKLNTQGRVHLVDGDAGERSCRE